MEAWCQIRQGWKSFGPWESVSLERPQASVSSEQTSLHFPSHTHIQSMPLASCLPLTQALPGWLFPPPGGRCRVCTCHLAEATSAPPPCPVTQGNCLCSNWLLPEVLKSRQRVLIEAYLFHFTR